LAVERLAAERLAAEPDREDAGFLAVLLRAVVVFFAAEDEEEREVLFGLAAADVLRPVDFEAGLRAEDADDFAGEDRDDGDFADEEDFDDDDRELAVDLRAGAEEPPRPAACVTRPSISLRSSASRFSRSRRIVRPFFDSSPRSDCAAVVAVSSACWSCWYAVFVATAISFG